MEAQLWSQLSPCENFGRPRATVTSFSPSISTITSQYFHHWYILIHPSITNSNNLSNRQHCYNTFQKTTWVGYGLKSFNKQIIINIFHKTFVTITVSNPVFCYQRMIVKSFIYKTMSVFNKTVTGNSQTYACRPWT